MTSAPQNKPAEAPTTGKVLKEIRQGSAAQQREIQNQLKQQPQNPQGLGIDGALRLLQFLEERVPCLNETQRLDLLTGKQLGYLTAPGAMEIRDRLQSWWLKAEDRQAVDTVLQLLMAHGGLPAPSVRLLKKVRDWVDSELIRQKLPRLQAVAWAREQVTRRAIESGLELDIDAEVATLVNTALKQYRAEVKDADELVYGELTVAEVRTWLACSRAVVKGKAGRAFTFAGQSLSVLQQETQTVKLFNACRRWGVEGPLALEKVLNKRLRGWNGNPYELTQDQNGQWRWGDGKPADREAAIAYRSVMEDKGDGFGPRITTVPVESERFVRRGEGYAGLFRDKDMFQIMREIERAEAAAEKSKASEQLKDGNQSTSNDKADSQ